MKRFMMGLGGFVFALSAAGLLQAADAATDAGKKTYDAKCAACHGKDAKGNAAMAKMFKVDASELNLTSEESAKESDEELLKIIADGKGKMPA